MRNVVVLLAFAACSKGQHARAGSGSAVVVAAGSDASVSSGDSAVAVVVDAAVAEPFFPEKLGPKEGIVFAEKQGGTVKGIPDGTKVEVVGATEMMVGSPVTGEVKVKYNGKNMSLLPSRILYGGEFGMPLHYSLDKKYVVYVPIMSCNDICQTELWLLGVDGRRVKLGEGTVDFYGAWKGETLAVSAGVLWVVSLADFTFKKYDDYMSPSFSPDGVLYVRSEDGSAYTLIDGKAKQVWKAPKDEPDENDDPYDVDGPPPVKWKKDGTPNFSTEFGPGAAE